jgi:DNA invertase Pin-like site-specific DNA recombinase
MSREQQEYSLENQAAAIRRYAEAHSFVVVRTYVDTGKSGIALKPRVGLVRLLGDVVGGKADYEAILVYDVSRWGRFQNVDEAAHYEFLCKRAGVPVHYCAEQFTNDGTLTSSILKTVKRVMAAEYSRALGVRCFEGQKRVAQLGFRAGGPAGYGLRRQIVSADGKLGRKLGSGEHKSLATDHVVLIRGPKNEVAWIRRIYEMVLHDRSSPRQVARYLNQNGVPYLNGRPWSVDIILRILTNPKYTGCIVWGQRSRKLRGPRLPNPPERWVMRKGAFAGLIDQRTFDRVQHVLQTRTNKIPDRELLRQLRRLLAAKKRLSRRIIGASRATASSSTYWRRFGSLERAFRLVGFHPRPGASTRRPPSRTASGTWRCDL